MLFLQREYADTGRVRPRERSAIRTRADLSRKGDCAHLAGGGARPKDKSVSADKAWVEMMDEERKV